MRLPAARLAPGLILYVLVGWVAQASAFWSSLVLAPAAAGVTLPVTQVVAGVALVPVLAVALSRVYPGVHYPGDEVVAVSPRDGLAVFVARSRWADSVR